jgi:hypothetical protein
MDNRAWQSGAAASPPDVESSPSSGYPIDGDPGTGTPPTIPGARWFHQIGEELRNVIVGVGLVPDDENLGQLKSAIQRMIDGGDWKASVRVASTAAINLAAPGATIDSVAMAAGDRFLEKNHGTPALRGIYIWNGAAVAATRAADFDEDTEVTAGVQVSVEEGTSNADTVWMLTTDNPVIVGTTALTFTQQNIVPDASETVKGKLELADAAECLAGTDTSRAVTPAGIRAAFNVTGNAPIFAVRAFVRTSNITGTIGASGNVSSVGNPATGRFTVNFTTALPDASYAYSFTNKALNAFGSADVVGGQHNSIAPTTSSCDFMVRGMTSFNGNNVEFSAFFVR